MITSLRVGAAFTAVALLSACGGSGQKAASDQPPTADEADSAAKAISFTADDLPGFKGTTHADDGKSEDDDKAFASCIGASAPKATASRTRSPTISPRAPARCRARSAARSTS